MTEANRLIDEQSPYLLQHAHNPVDWYPWGTEAFEKARAEDKPIFLSIGYSTCHWCHVMEHESFEEPATAALLKEHFIAIKVDREERPDIDRIYMSFVQASTGQGGWPMSVWLTPDLKPFAGGTYFPPRDAYGRPGFKTVLQSIAEAWKKDREQIIHHGHQVVESLAAAGENSGTLTNPDPHCIEKACNYFRRSFDDKLGGFSPAPKFPRPVIFEFLFNTAARSADAEASTRAREMSLFTLRQMAAGGMWDHIGGGFHRYSVDAEWHVPHFEKMLYDQAQLAKVYLIAYQVTREERYADVARGIFAYLERDLTAEGGGFYSAEDADSYPEAGAGKKLEGAFYAWTTLELKELMSEEEFEIFSAAYDIREGGNVSPSSDPHGELTGKNVLIERGLVDPEKRELLDSAKAKVMEAREQRPRPHLDDKIITAWNGMMVSALVYGYVVLGEEKYLTQAERAVEFVHQNLADLKSGKLERSFRKTSSGIEGFAEDYAQWIQALIDLYEATGKISRLQQALKFQETMDALLWDEKSGGYFSSVEASDVLIRMKDDNDGAEPSANSVASLNLARLADMLQRNDLLEKSEQILRAFSPVMEQFPAALPLMLNALAWRQSKPRQVVLAGSPSPEERKKWLNHFFREYHPAQVILHADGSAAQDWLVQQGAPIKGMKPVEGKTAAYVCEDFICKAPITEL